MTTRHTLAEQQYILQLISYIDSLVIKSDYDANLYETKTSKYEGNLYNLAKNNKDTIFNYTITRELIESANLENEWLEIFNFDKNEFILKLNGNIEVSDILLTILRNKTIETYVEQNAYYRMLNGEPANDDEIVYVEDTIEGGVYPLHFYTSTFHAKMYIALTEGNNTLLNKIIKKERDEGRDYAYFDYLTRRSPYHIAREAVNFQILYGNAALLHKSDVQLFYTAYYQAHDYIITVPYIKSYAQSEELYDRFIGVTIIFLAILRFFTFKMDNYLRNEFVTTEEKKLFFEQYNVAEIMDIGLSNELLVQFIIEMEDLISIKGSEEVIGKILDMFGFKNIDIYKYLLMKTINCDPITKEIIIDPCKSRKDNYSIDLVRIPINLAKEARTISKYMSDKTQHVPFSSVALPDAYFGETTITTSESMDNLKLLYIKEIEDTLKETEEFSSFYTKYLAILSHVDFTRSTIESTYLIVSSLLNDPNVLNYKFKFNKIQDIISMRDLVASLNLITCLRYDVSDDIITDTAEIAQFMGFNIEPNLEELKAIEYYIIKDKDEFKSVKLPDVIADDEIFIIKTQPIKQYDENVIDSGSYIYNMEVHDMLIQKMKNCTNYKEYTALQKIFDYNMHSKVMIDTFGSALSYTEYLMNKNIKLYNYIMAELNVRTSGMWNDDNGIRTNTFITICADLITEFLNALINQMHIDSSIEQSIMTTYVDATVVFSKLLAVVNLFKHYTVSFTTNEVEYTVGGDRGGFIKILDFITSEEVFHGTYVDNIGSHIYFLIGDRMQCNVKLSIPFKTLIAEFTNYNKIEHVNFMLELKYTYRHVYLNRWIKLFVMLVANSSFLNPKDIIYKIAEYIIDYILIFSVKTDISVHTALFNAIYSYIIKTHMSIVHTIKDILENSKKDVTDAISLYRKLYKNCADMLDRLYITSSCMLYGTVANQFTIYHNINPLFSYNIYNGMRFNEHIRIYPYNSNIIPLSISLFYTIYQNIQHIFTEYYTLFHTVHIDDRILNMPSIHTYIKNHITPVELHTMQSIISAQNVLDIDSQGRIEHLINVSCNMIMEHAVWHNEKNIIRIKDELIELI